MLLESHVTVRNCALRHSLTKVRPSFVARLRNVQTGELAQVGKPVAQ
jgi:hypothetical protein